jgi:FtsZ-binding cell division protein ZapB
MSNVGLDTTDSAGHFLTTADTPDNNTTTSKQNTAGDENDLIMTDATGLDAPGLTGPISTTAETPNNSDTAEKHNPVVDENVTFDNSSHSTDITSDEIDAIQTRHLKDDGADDTSPDYYSVDDTCDDGDTHVTTKMNNRVIMSNALIPSDSTTHATALSTPSPYTSSIDNINKITTDTQTDLTGEGFAHLLTNYDTLRKDIASLRYDLSVSTASKKINNIILNELTEENSLLHSDIESKTIEISNLHSNIEDLQMTIVKLQEHSQSLLPQIEKNNLKYTKLRKVYADALNSIKYDRRMVQEFLQDCRDRVDSIREFNKDTDCDHLPMFTFHNINWCLQGFHPLT